MKLKGNLSTYLQPTFSNLEINPAKNVYIGLGAGGVIQDVCNVILEEGDQTVILDPHFPHHSTCPHLAGSTVKSSELKLNKNTLKWELDIENFKS